MKYKDRAANSAGAVSCVCNEGYLGPNCATCVRYVNPAATGTGTSLSWANAATKLQTAIDSASAAVVADAGADAVSRALAEKAPSVPFYRLLSRHVADTGLVVIQATSPYFAPRSYWCVDATLKEAGYRTWPYHALVPSFGEWGFILAAPGRADFQPPTSYRVPTRFLDADTTHQMFSFAPDMPRQMLPPMANLQPSFAAL